MPSYIYAVTKTISLTVTSKTLAAQPPSPVMYSPAAGLSIDLVTGQTLGAFNACNLAVSDSTGAPVDVVWIYAPNINLGNVTITGDLGLISVGNVAAPSTAIQILQVNSMGTNNSTVLQSIVQGSVTQLNITNNLENAFLDVQGSIEGITIGGLLKGGSEGDSARITTANDMGPVKINKGISGGNGTQSGLIDCGGNLTSIDVTGCIHGGQGILAGSIQVGGTCGKITISGNVTGGAGYGSALISITGNITDVISITGSLFGGSGVKSGAIICSGNTKKITIQHDVVGASGTASGFIGITGTTDDIEIDGNISCGSGQQSGEIQRAPASGSIIIKGGIN